MRLSAVAAPPLQEEEAEAAEAEAAEAEPAATEPADTVTDAGQTPAPKGSSEWEQLPIPIAWRPLPLLKVCLTEIQYNHLSDTEPNTVYSCQCPAHARPYACYMCA